MILCPSTHWLKPKSSNNFVFFVFGSAGRLAANQLQVGVLGVGLGTPTPCVAGPVAVVAAVAHWAVDGPRGGRRAAPLRRAGLHDDLQPLQRGRHRAGHAPCRSHTMGCRGSLSASKSQPLPTPWGGGHPSHLGRMTQKLAKNGFGPGLVGSKRIRRLQCRVGHFGSILADSLGAVVRSQKLVCHCKTKLYPPPCLVAP